jgi:hypothetical protein
MLGAALGRRNSLQFTSNLIPSGFTLDFTSASLPGGVTLTRSTTGTRFNSSGVLVTEAIDTARFDYDPATLALRGLLVEASSTNLLTNSGALSGTGWSARVATATVNNATSPLGTTTATLITATATGTSFSALLGQSSQTAAGNAVATVFVKKGNNATCVLSISDDVAHSGAMLFNFDTLAISTSAAGNGSVLSSLAIPINNGWYKLILACSFSGVTAGRKLGIGAQNSLSGTNTNGATMLAWGGQYESITSSTSYIATTAATVTRASDSAAFTIPAGTNKLIYKYDDNSTQLVTVTPGAYTIPTTLNRAWIKTITGYA